MGYVCKLTKGNKSLDLGSGRYAVVGNISSGVGTAIVPLDIMGSSNAEIERGIDDINQFLEMANDPAEPLLLHWQPDTYMGGEDAAWGQSRRVVEISGGQASKPEMYWMLRYSFLPDVHLELTTKGGAEGARQLCANAMGGVVEDRIGIPQGQSRGVIVPAADSTEGNWFNNPIFAHATWNNGWTAGADITAIKNTDQEHILFGTRSAWLTANTAADAKYTMSINVGDTDIYMLSCYVKNVDGSAVTTLDCGLWYGGAVPTSDTSYTSVGDGWYRIIAQVYGINGASQTGIEVTPPNILYADGFQLEKRSLYVTPLMCGDFPGHEWVGTPHESRSVRGAPYLRLPIVNLLDSGVCTMRFVWTPSFDSTSLSGSAYLFEASSSSDYAMYYNPATPGWYWATQGGGGSFTANNTYVFHVTANNAAYNVWVNGAQLPTWPGAVSPGFIDPVAGNLYIGSDDAAGSHIGGTFSGLKIWRNYAASTDEVLADYNNILQLISDGQSVDPIPYVFTQNGDGVCQNLDSTTDQNWALVAGVPGDLPAGVDLKMVVAGMNDADLYISRLDIPYNRFIDPEFLTYVGAPDVVSLGTSDDTLATIALDDDEFPLLAGRKIAVMVRGYDSTDNNVSLRTGVNPGGAYYYTTYLATNWATTTDASIDLSPDIFITEDEELYRWLGVTRATSVRVQGKRSTGTANFNVIAAQLLPFPINRFINKSGAGIAPTILYINGKGYEVNSAALSYTYDVDGARFELFPNRYNLLISWLGKETVLSEAGDTLTYSAVYVTPRWKTL